MDFDFVIGSCWFLPEDIGPLLARLKQRPEIADDPEVGEIRLQRFNPGEFPMTAYDRVMYDHFSMASMRFARRMAFRFPVITTMVEPMRAAGLTEGLPEGRLIPVEAIDLKSAALRLFHHGAHAFRQGCADVPKGQPRHLMAFAGSYLVTGTAKAAQYLLLPDRKESILFHTRHCGFADALEFLADLARHRHEFGRILVVLGTEPTPGGKYFVSRPEELERVRTLCAAMDILVEPFDASQLYLLALEEILVYAIGSRRRQARNREALHA